MAEPQKAPGVRQLDSLRTVRKATLFQLTFMIYAAVCGGAFGLEEMVSGAGPGLSLLVLILMPLAFSVPVSLIVAEMTARFPVEGGSYRWAGMALGNFWAVQSGWWTWLTSAIMNTLYAVLFVSYTKQAFPVITGKWEWLLAVVLIWAAYYLNLRGVNLVGNAAILLTILLLVPFVVMTVLGFYQWKFNPVIPFRDPSKSLMASMYSAVAIAIWLYAGYEKLSAAAEETENPQRNFVRALLWATVAAILSYVLPTVAGLAATAPWQGWTTGYFSTLAGKIGGPRLQTGMTVSALFSNLLLLTVTMLSASRVTMAMAQDKALPSVLAKIHPVRQTPSAALFLNAAAYSLLAFFNFQQLIVLNSVFQIANILVIYASLLAVRSRDSRSSSSFQVPLGHTGLLLLMLPTCLLALVVGTGIKEPKEVASIALAVLAGFIIFKIKIRTPATESSNRTPVVDP